MTQNMNALRCAPRELSRDTDTQVLIREAVPEKHVIVSVNTNGSLTQGYILPAGVCGCGVYQDKIAVVRRQKHQSGCALSPPTVSAH